MITLMRGGNIGCTATTLHPAGLTYVLLKRDIPGSCILLYEQDWNGTPTRLIKMWANRSNLRELHSTLQREEQAAGRPVPFPVEAVEKPISTPSLVCRPDGAILINHTFGGTDGLCDWQVEVLAGACPPFTHQGTWPLTVSATDTEARRVALSAQQQAAAALGKANEAEDTAKEAKKEAAKKGSGLTPDQVLGLVSDDIALGLRKDAQGRRQGRLIHALWQVVESALNDLLWARGQKQ